MSSIRIDMNSGRLWSEHLAMEFADRPYQYRIEGTVDQSAFDEALAPGAMHWNDEQEEGEAVFPDSQIRVHHTIRWQAGAMVETLSLENHHSQPIALDHIQLGFVSTLESRKDWRLVAIPFRVQLNGSVQDYTGHQLMAGEGANPVNVDKSRDEPPVVADGLWSEAWAWCDGSQGLVVIKYNNRDIELSVAALTQVDQTGALRFGGVGRSLYGEPSNARILQPGQRFAFGETWYLPFQGGLEEAFYTYRDFLESRGHTVPASYHPPVNWNELYDVGWYHSNPEELQKFYTQDALLKEAKKARASGCDLLYLDPGWEVAEGTTKWDVARLGSVPDFIHALKDQFGLDFGYRTILRTYKEEWPSAYFVEHPREFTPVEPFWIPFFEPCLCHEEFWQEKLERILAIARHGVRFIMFDEMDWRGPCYATHHSHPTPSTPLMHSLAVYRLAAEVRRRCPGLLTEVHDPIWPWETAVYVPTYFRQGSEGIGSYDENWGFEYMWNCIEDLKTGRALSLYYYNLGCSIPLYLHISMATDNDPCLFFWWTASTVRHLGIGGKTHEAIMASEHAPQGYDGERRFQAYTRQMGSYQKLKAYFARGRFFGIAEHIHLHTLPERVGGVINVFNLTDDPQEICFTIPRTRLKADHDLGVVGADATWREDGVEFRLALDGLTPALVLVGDATEES
jgi:hypothetical protein